MFLVSLLIFNILLAIIIIIFNKLTCGICKCSNHLVGKVVIVTGGNAGIGYETAKNLAERGARVIIACRNEGRGTDARDKIIASTGNKDVHYHQMDLASLASVRAFADNIIKTEKRLDILINNAGIFLSENVKTEDGLLQAMQINHFGPFLLTSLLLPLLKSSAPSRIINVSSRVYTYGDIDFQNLNMEKESKETFSYMKTYSNSKLCNVLMTIELKRLLEGSGVTANCLHPGAVDTSIVAGSGKWWVKALTPLGRLFCKTAWEGAQTSIYLAVSPEVKEVSGCYFSDCRMYDIKKLADDTDVPRKLWEVTERLTKLK